MTRLDLSALPSLVKSRTLKRFCRKGIPMTHRAKIWYGSFQLIVVVWLEHKMKMFILLFIVPENRTVIMFLQDGSVGCGREEKSTAAALRGAIYLFPQGIFWNSIKVVVILAFFRQCLASQRIRIQLWLSRSQSTFREPSRETFISLRSLPQTRKNSRYSTSS